MFLLALFAQNKPKGSPFERPEIIWGTVALVGALFAGALVIYLVDKWRKRAALAEQEVGLELTDYRAMLESGEISESEYNKLRLKVADRVKHGAASTAPPANGLAPPASSTSQASAPPVAGPFPPGYFDDPTTSPPVNLPPPKPAGGNAPTA